MYATDRRQTDKRQTLDKKAALNASALFERRHNHLPFNSETYCAIFFRRLEWLPVGNCEASKVISSLEDRKDLGT